MSKQKKLTAIDKKKILLQAEDSWLHIDVKDDELYNPLIQIPEEFRGEEHLYIQYLFTRSEYFSFICKEILNIELLPTQIAILQELWLRKFPMFIASRGFGKSFLLGVYALLRALLYPGRKIVICGSVFRQSKVIFEYIENIWRNAPILRDICTSSSGPRHDVDMWRFHINQSVISALPIGTGDNIRGQRANDIIMDEFATSSEDVFETVIAGFGAVAPSPAQAVKAVARKHFLEKHNIFEESNIILAASNQIVLAGTAFYSFNHFCRYWNIWRGIINSKGDHDKVAEIFGGEVPKDFNWRDYSVMRIPLELVPEGFMDEASIARSKATSNSGTYLHEYKAVFVSDSAGFFKRSVIEKCVASEKNKISFPSCEDVVYSASLYGDRSKKYIMGIDPAATEDNFAIVILEIHPDHRRVVYCWTTNKGDHAQKQKREMVPENDYYSYCVRKIRDLMKVFPIERIVLDSQGGGRAILESLENTSQLEPNEQPIFCIIDLDKPKDSDSRIGLHIVEPINFVDAKWTTDSNQGLCADLENRVLLFPFFDSITLAEVEFTDSKGNAKFDNLEDNIINIEELKNELSTIVITETATGRPRWDTPDIKGAGSKKGRLKKDRYSALLMANMTARTMMSSDPIVYDMVGEGGGFANTIRKSDLEGPLFSGNQAWAKALNDFFS